MLEWICPRCDRAVDPAFLECPFCKKPGAAAGPAGEASPSHGIETAGRNMVLALADWISRILMGFVAVAALIYFLVFVWAYYSGNDALLARLTRLLFWRR
jgi:hypothetical protein